MHIPLAKQLPGLIKYEINDGAIISTTGHADIYRIANLYFESMEAMKKAFASDIGQQCAADRKIFAPIMKMFRFIYTIQKTPDIISLQNRIGCRRLMCKPYSK